MSNGEVIQVGNLHPDTPRFKNRTMGRVYDIKGIAPTINTCGGGGRTPMITNAELEVTKTKQFIEQMRGHETMKYRIRKLTPKECFRLMGVDDKDIDKLLNASISNSQLYKMAGNSIVVDVLYHLFRKMFVETENESNQLSLF